MAIAYLMSRIVSARRWLSPRARPGRYVRAALPIVSGWSAMATVVAFHAHPDDEALLTGGTLARVEHLGYADSGHGPVLFPDPPGRVRFVRADLDEAATKLAALIRAERADLLMSYDERGGYGHRDHVRVHDVGARAARLAGVRVVEV